MGNEGLAVLKEGKMSLQAIEGPPLLVVVVLCKCLVQACRCLSEKDKATKGTTDSTLEGYTGPGFAFPYRKDPLEDEVVTVLQEGLKRREVRM